MRRRFGFCGMMTTIYTLVIAVAAMIAWASIPAGATTARITGNDETTTLQPQLVGQLSVEPPSGPILLLATRGLTASDIDMTDEQLVTALQSASVANMRTASAHHTVDPAEAREALTPLIDASDVVDLGSITTAPDDQRHAAQVADVLTAFLDTIDGLNPADYEHIVLASIADATTTPRLQFAAIWYTDSTRGGLLGSAATHTDGLISLTDLNRVPTPEFATGFDALHVVPSRNIESAMAALQDQQRHAEAAAIASPWWFVFYGAMALVGIVAALAHFIRRPAQHGESRGGPASIWRNLAWWNTVVFALIPSALLLNLLPWWNYPMPRVTPFAISLLIAVVMTALMRQTDYPVSMIAALTLFLIGADLVAHKGWATDSVLGPLTMTFRRFYGVTNRVYIILIVVGLLTALPWLMTQRSQPRHAARGVIAIGSIVLALDAIPQWGADFGGPPGIIAAFGLVYLAVSSQRLRWYHSIWWAGLTVVVMAGISIVDALSPEPTHIGALWKTLGSPEGSALLGRKLSDQMGTVAGSPLIFIGFTLALVALVTIIIGAVKLYRSSELHRTVIAEAVADTPLPAIASAIAAGVIIGALTNDSGTIMLADGLSIGIPALLAAVTHRLHQRRMHGTESPESAPTALPYGPEAGPCGAEADASSLRATHPCTDPRDADIPTNHFPSPDV